MGKENYVDVEVVSYDDFSSYVEIQESGIVNMFDINSITAIDSNLTKEICLLIMEHYKTLYALYFNKTGDDV